VGRVKHRSKLVHQQPVGDGLARFGWGSGMVWIGLRQRLGRLWAAFRQGLGRV